MSSSPIACTHQSLPAIHMYTYSIKHFFNIVTIYIVHYLLLLQERSRNTHLQSELRSKSVSQKAMTELQEMLGDIRAERDLLKQTNDRLMKG